MEYKLAEMFSLSRIEWQFFGTLTFREPFLRSRQDGKSGYLRFSRFLKFGRSLCRSLDYSANNFTDRNLNCLREEAGEIGGQWHYHYLMGGLGDNVVNIGTCKFMEHLWLNECGGGWTRIRVFDQRQSGVEYISKCLDPRDRYEFNKTGLANSLTFSPACITRLSKLDVGECCALQRRAGKRNLTLKREDQSCVEVSQVGMVARNNLQPEGWPSSDLRVI
jgi:hypothetical protein